MSFGMLRPVKSAPPGQVAELSTSSKCKPRKLTSASQPTVASRGKIRPEPKFQKVVSSQILSQMRRDSRLISKNPERFLEGIIEGGRHGPQPVNTESFTAFLSGLCDDESKNGCRTTLANLERKCKHSKTRNLLLKLGSNPAIQRMSSASERDMDQASTCPSTFSSFFSGDSATPDVTHLLHSTDSMDQVELILQSFLDEIRVANVSNIVEWVTNRVSLTDLDLPFGFPSAHLEMLKANHEENAKYQDFITSATDEFFLLDAEYHAKLEEIDTKITDNFREIEKVDWSPRDSALLFHIMNIMNSADYSMTGSNFSKEKLATELATRIFPLYSRENIISQKYRLKVKRALEEKKDSVIKQWIRDKENLVKKINSAWTDILKKLQQKNDFEQEKRFQQEKCRYWVSLLEEMRKENRKKIRTIETLVEPLEQELQQKGMLKERQERERKLQQKRLVDNFRKLKVEAYNQYRKQQEELAEVENQHKKVQMEHNRARVHVRQREYQMKLERQKQLERQKEEEKQAKLKLLESLKEKVEFDYDPTSILMDTHASLVRSHEVEMELLLGKSQDVNSETVRFFQQRYSFPAETVWKDMRVRVETKLREAGLIDNSYARHVLLAMQPTAKPHLQSQIKFDEN